MPDFCKGRRTEDDIRLIARYLDTQNVSTTGEMLVEADCVGASWEMADFDRQLFPCAPFCVNRPGKPLRRS